MAKKINMNFDGVELIENLDLHRKCNIRKAFESLSGKFGMVVTIVEDDNKLCGIVTDGDLRKALLNGNSLETPLESVMNEKPVVLKSKDLIKYSDFSYLINELVSRGINLDTGTKIFAIPLIDDNDNVLGLVTLGMLQNFGKEGISSLNSGLLSVPHILVVGGAGYIGSVLVDMLLKKGWKVRVLDNLIYKQESLSNFKNEDKFSYTFADVCNIHSIVDAIIGIDCVVFLAEIVGDPSCKYVPDTALKTNYLAVNSMATLCSHLNINRFVYASSCSVYGANTDPNVLINENSRLNPVSHYGRMKVLSEQAVFNQLNPLFSPTILRFATVFGHSFRPRFDLVVNTFAKNAFFNRPITVYGGDQWRPNIHVRDVAQAIVRVLESPIEKVKKQVFNIGSNNENHTINEIASLTKEVFPEIKIHIRNNEVDKRNYRVDFGKMKKILNYQPQVSVLEGLKELKKVFEEGLIAQPDNVLYNNIEFLTQFENDGKATNSGI